MQIHVCIYSSHRWSRHGPLVPFPIRCNGKSSSGEGPRPHDGMLLLGPVHWDQRWPCELVFPWADLSPSRPYRFFFPTFAKHASLAFYR